MAARGSRTWFGVMLAAAVALASAGAAGQTGGRAVPVAEGFGAGAYRPGGPVEGPVVLTRAEPRYTSSALRQRIQGEVELELVVDAAGSVADVRVLRSLDTAHGLDQEATAAARRWTFKPARYNGRAVAALVTLVLEFRVHARDADAQTPRANDPDEFVRGTWPEDTPDLVAPKLVRSVPARYTSNAMRAKIQGTAYVDAVVGIDGRVDRVRIARSIDHEHGLDAEALAAVRQWQFEPGRLGGRAVPVLISVYVEFRLH